MSLSALPVRSLIDLAKHLNGGPLGFDPARDPRTSKKPDLISWISGQWTGAEIDAAIATLTPPPDPVGDALDQLRDALATSKAPPIDESVVRRIAREEAQSLAPRRIEVIDQKGAAIGGLDEHTHPLFDKVLRLASAGLNVLLIGPAGCGKTHLSHQVAKALRRSFGSISGSAGVSESQLTGRLLPTGDGGRFEYTASPFVREYESGGVFLFDEIDAFDPNCLLVVNSALANGGFEVEARAAAGLSTYVKRAANSVLIGSANTFGTGADAIYVGRNGLDAASLDRWYCVQMSYDPTLEAALIGVEPPAGVGWQASRAPSESEIAALGEWVLEIRRKASAARLRRVISTRAVQKAITARRAGVPTTEVQADLLCGWSKDEISKVV